MPGYAQFLDVENSVQLLGNISPAVGANVEQWNQLRPVTDKFKQNVTTLSLVTTGSQKQQAQTLLPIADELDRAVNDLQGKSLAFDAMPDGEEKDNEGYIINNLSNMVRMAIQSLPGYVAGFDQKKLQQKRFTFG